VTNYIADSKQPAKVQTKKRYNSVTQKKGGRGEAKRKGDNSIMRSGTQKSENSVQQMNWGVKRVGGHVLGKCARPSHMADGTQRRGGGKYSKLTGTRSNLEGRERPR